MTHASKLFINTAIALAAVAGGCGEITPDAHGTDAADETGEAAPVDPHCQDGMQLKDLPAGACVIGASCAVLVEPQICANGKWPPGASPRQWYCVCPSGEWKCTKPPVLSGFFCEGGAPTDAAADATDLDATADVGIDASDDTGGDAPNG